MKKLIAVALFVSLTLVLSACGPNSTYFKVGTQTVYYYDGTDIVMDPYTIFENNLKDIETKDAVDWIKQVPNEELENIRENFRVEVEYKLAGSHDSFKNYDFGDQDNYNVIVENPVDKFSEIVTDEDGITSTVKGEAKYEFRLHFINIETEDEDRMINYIGVVKFVPANINPLTSQVTVSKYDSYTLLNNVTLDETPADKTLEDLYVFDYTVVDEKGNEVSVTDGKATFTYAGTFTVTVEAAIIVTDDGSGSGDEGGSDDDSGASEPWDGGMTEVKPTFLSNVVKLAADTTDEVKTGEVFVFTYTIIVE